MSDATAIAERVRAFVREVVIPAEPRDAASEHGPAPELREELQAAARAAGLFAPHVGSEFGGLGLDVRGQALVFEEAGYSLLGPLALNCSAPDEGNMHLLEAVASTEQKERYLRPLAEGKVRSAFAMTEPAPGAGSDPTMLLTTARLDGDDWVINGHKWFITGAEGCAFYICMARTAAEIKHDEGATMLLVPADNPGVRIERLIPTMDRAFSGGHAVVHLRRLPRAGRRRARRGGARLPLRPGAAGARAADALHALARPGAARARHRARPRRRALGLRRAAARAGHGAGAGRRLGDRHRGQPRADPHAAPRCSTPAGAGRTSRRWPRSSSPRRSAASSIARCRSAAGSASATTCRWRATPARCAPFRIYDGPSETHRWSIARRAARRRQRER